MDMLFIFAGIMCSCDGRH